MKVCRVILSMLSLFSSVDTRISRDRSSVKIPNGDAGIPRSDVDLTDIAPLETKKCAGLPEVSTQGLLEVGEALGIDVSVVDGFVKNLSRNYQVTCGGTTEYASLRPQFRQVFEKRHTIL